MVMGPSTAPRGKGDSPPMGSLALQWSGTHLHT